jgi:hypothetical protein
MVAHHALVLLCSTGRPAPLALVSNTVGMALRSINFGLVRGCLRLSFKAIPFFVQHRIEFFDKGQ